MRIILALAALLLTATIASAQSVEILYPRPKAAFARAGAFTIDASTRIVVADAQSAGSVRAVAWLQRSLRAAAGSDLTIVTHAQYAPGRSIVVAEIGASDSIDTRLHEAMPPGEPTPRAGGYVLDVSANAILIGGAGEEGLFNAIATLRQLVGAGGSVEGAHVWDWPDFPVRWVFNQQNLRVATAVQTLRTMLDTMAVLKLNAIQQNDFKYSILQMQPQSYHDSARAYRAASEERGIGVVPGVAPIGYSEGILWNDPNLAEGFPATSRYVIESDTGRLIPDSRVALPNGGFESVDGNGRFTGWSYYDESTVSVDRAIVHGGATSARCSNFAGVNSRFIRNVSCRPNSAYVMTAWMRTENLKGGELRLLAIGNDGGTTSRVLAYTMFGLPATTGGWRKVQVVFNTLEFSQMYLYAGLWSGGSGTFWLDDVEIRDAGLANVLRRNGAPLHVRSVGGATEYREGIDFAPVVDPELRFGYYPWHQPPTFRRLPGGTLRNGDSIEISFHHPMTTYGNEDGIGGVMTCLSEDTLYSILRDQISRVDALYDAPAYFMGHDEIRSMNRDSACLRRGLSPAEILADNVTRVAAMIDSIHPGARRYVWSDMFDSLHNAVDDYFLVNGDLRGVWDMIPRDLTIVNWNGGQAMRSSLDFFARHGFRQIASPYYDQRDTRNIRAWRLALESTPGADGMMYTTWVGDFDFLRPFAYYAWGAGPNLVHAPLDTTVLLRASLDSVAIEARVWADPYDRDDSITSVTALIDFGTRTEEIVLTEVTSDTFVGYAQTIAREPFSYHIVARNAQRLERTTPEYIVVRALSSGIVASESASMNLRVGPNPMSGAGTVSFVAPVAGSWSLDIIDALGRVVHRVEGAARPAEQITVPIDATDLAHGAYRCAVRHAGLLRTAGLVVR